MKTKSLLIIFLGILGFGSGLCFSLKTFEGQKTTRLYVQGRLVAGTNSPVKKSLLVDEKLVNIENIIASMSSAEDNSLGVIGLRFGNYISEYGQSLCSAFNTVEVILYGEGMAVSGQPPRIILTGACPTESSTDLGSMNFQLKTIFPIFLISDCRSNATLNDAFILENGTEVKITNMDFGVSEPDWIVEKVSLFDKNYPVNGIEFDFQEIKKIRQASGQNLKDGFVRIPCH